MAKKTVTWRDWDDRYAKTFHKGDIVQAYNKNPRCKGKKMALIRITQEPYKQWLHDVTDEDEIKEGGLWGSGKAYQEAMGEDREVWVIDFERIKEFTIAESIELDKKNDLEYEIMRNRELFG